MKSLRIISGGQTGVDRAVLDAALGAGIDCGGWCPSGRRAEDGRIPDHYPLKETASAEYADRTRANVRDSQAMLILVRRKDARLGGGTRLAAEAARALGRPVRTMALADTAAYEQDIARLLAWMADDDITVLNIAGPRESDCPGIYVAARRFLAEFLDALSRRRA